MPEAKILVVTATDLAILKSGLLALEAEYEAAGLSPLCGRMKQVRQTLETAR